MRLFLLAFILSCTLMNCNSGTESSDQAQTPETPGAEANQKHPAPYFVIENYQDSLDNPRSTINLNVSNKKIKVADVVACEKIKPEDYPQYQIPEEAIDACGGWWAGAGDYFYLISNGDDNYTVMQGEMYEEKETDDYDYKMVMNLSNKLIPRSE